MSVHQSGMEGKMDIFLKQFQSVGIPLRVTKVRRRCNVSMSAAEVPTAISTKC